MNYVIVNDTYTYGCQRLKKKERKIGEPEKVVEIGHKVEMAWEMVQEPEKFVEMVDEIVEENDNVGGKMVHFQRLN